MARAGSIWVESTEIHYLDSSADEQSVFGNFVSTTTKRAGSIWVEGTALHFMNENGNSERNIVGTLVAAGSRRAGGLWVEGTELHYIDANGDERKFFPLVCSSYVFTGASISTGGGDCVPAGGTCNPEATALSSWTPKSTCTPGHMAFYLSTNGGSFLVQRDNTGDDCNRSNYTRTLAGTLTNNLSFCNSFQCTKTCAARTYRWRVEMHASATDHTVCDSMLSSTTSTKYFCACHFCLQGA